jgi:hypothetical protein
MMAILNQVQLGSRSVVEAHSAKTYFLIAPQSRNKSRSSTSLDQHLERQGK